jgi:transposase
MIDHIIDAYNRFPDKFHQTILDNIHQIYKSELLKIRKELLTDEIKLAAVKKTTLRLSFLLKIVLIYQKR